jgi:hypothetical protein
VERKRAAACLKAVDEAARVLHALPRNRLRRVWRTEEHEQAAVALILVLRHFETMRLGNLAHHLQRPVPEALHAP